LPVMSGIRCDAFGSQAFFKSQRNLHHSIAIPQYFDLPVMVRRFFEIEWKTRRWGRVAPPSRTAWNVPECLALFQAAALTQVV